MKPCRFTRILQSFGTSGAFFRLKRGGQRQIISLDEAAAEGLYLREPVESLTPEKLFERRWALASQAMEW